MAEDAVNVKSADKIPIERLLAYQEAIALLREEETVRLGELLETLPETPPKTVIGDLAAFGITNTRAINLNDLDRHVRVNANQLITSGIKPAVKIYGEADRAAFVRLFSDESVRSPERAEAREAAFDFGLANPDHFLLALGSMEANYTAYRHQVESAKTIVERMYACGIVADEVGLGKTITGALILLELILRNLVQTSLILVPSNLLDQWAGSKKSVGELKRFFGFQPETVRGKGPSSLAKLQNSPHLLLDLDKAKQTPFKEILLRRDWDCIVIDEAHRLRNYSTDRTRFCYSLKGTFRVLLTATPVHNSAFDIFTEITNVRPGALGHREAYRKLHVREDDGSIYDPEFLQKKLNDTVTRTRRQSTGLRFAERRIKHVPVKKRTEQEKYLYSDLLRFLRATYRRHLRGAVPINLPPGTVRHVEAFVLVALMVLREMGSHPSAALKTLNDALRRRIEKIAEITRDYVDVDALDVLTRKYKKVKWGPGTHRKTDRLLRRLDYILKRSGKCVIYTEFLPTLRALQTLIQAKVGLDRDPPYDLVVYHGRLSRESKRSALWTFENSLKPCVLLSTDCGGEGLNLQSAGAVINFDFPWNPMRIEQRIGRIDRIGQDRNKIYVYNFYTENTIEAYVYDVLQRKLNVCHDILGAFDSPITRLMLRRPEDLGIGEIILRCEDDEEMDKQFQMFVGELREEVIQYGSREDVWF
jgi:SNF2 family DNA or RNA helicase